jgi:hypothetical protein
MSLSFVSLTMGRLSSLKDPVQLCSFDVMVGAREKQSISLVSFCKKHHNANY